METILSNFQQKLALVKSFQHFAIKFLTKKSLVRLKPLTTMGSNGPQNEI